MPNPSAGILLYRHGEQGIEVLLVHPGGPFWARRDHGVWSVPKGEHGEDEDPAACARREFEEELGTAAPDGPMIDLGSVRQRSGKTVSAWALEGDLDTAQIASNTFTMEWPPRSGVQREFPEVDRAQWFGLAEARDRIIEAQAELLDRLAARVGEEGDAGGAFEGS